MNIFVDWKNRLKKGHMFSIICILLIIVALLMIALYKKQTEYRQASENSYNAAFFELVDYVQNVESYLAKAQITTSSEQSAETLTNLWREANLAQAYLSRLPIESQELANTEKFLNQVSDYSYSLSRKNINNQNLTEDDLNNLKELHKYSQGLEVTLNQLSDDLNSGRFTWGELTKKGKVAFAQQVDNIAKESFSNLEQNFHQYSGLIYDGAFSDHLTSVHPKALTGDDIDENEAQKIAEEFVDLNNKKVTNLGYFENATIPCFDFSIEKENDEVTNISISKKGGHIISMNTNRNVDIEAISEESAVQQGKDFLNKKGFDNMKETYYLKQDGIATINYAYNQEGVIMYPDLIKVKVALDNGEILGAEFTGYLNNHEIRKINDIAISKDEAKKNLNKNLELISEGMAVIPTEWKTEILCYEFKGKIDGREFLVYVNAETGKEEDVLVVTNTPNGTITK